MRGKVLKRQKSRSVSAKEVRHVLETTPHWLDQGLSRVCLCQVFDLASGGALLLFDNGKGRLYESIDELRAMIDEVERVARSGPRSYRLSIFKSSCSRLEFNHNGLSGTYSVPS